MVWSEGGVQLALISGNVRRDDFTVEVLALTAGEFTFLQAIRDGNALTAALASDTRV